MRSQRINIKKKIIFSLLFIIMGGIIFNSTFFLHSHRTACGKVVVHAHPFNKGAENENPFSHHEHNKIELDQFSSIDYYTVSQICIDLDFKFNFELEILSKPDLGFTSTVYFSHTTRGPPYKSTLV